MFFDWISSDREIDSHVISQRSFKCRSTVPRWIVPSIETLDAGLTRFHIQPFKQRRLALAAVTSGCLQQLASLPTTTPESAGLCVWRAIGNLIRVTDFQ
jgi:hypothetical protein